VDPVGLRGIRDRGPSPENAATLVAAHQLGRIGYGAEFPFSILSQTRTDTGSFANAKLEPCFESKGLSTRLCDYRGRILFA
jgi:hypothetical protein